MVTKRIANIAQNKVILKFIIEAILFCAKQCITLREDLESSKNPGNFLSILKLMSNHSIPTYFHLQ